MRQVHGSSASAMQEWNTTYNPMQKWNIRRIQSRVDVLQMF